MRLFGTMVFRKNILTSIDKLEIDIEIDIEIDMKIDMEMDIEMDIEKARCHALIFFGR